MEEVYLNIAVHYILSNCEKGEIGSILMLQFSHDYKCYNLILFFWKTKLKINYFADLMNNLCVPCNSIPRYSVVSVL